MKEGNPMNDFAKDTHEISIRHALRSGDVGYLIHLHGWIYSQECGYNHTFEGYVCKTFSEFFDHYDPNKDRIWFAEADGEIIGAIAIIGHSPVEAQLRWFILHPDYRGKGIGKILYKEALNYCREKHYKKVFLATTQDQQTAIRMYLKEGFKKVSESKNESWGKALIEEIYELML